MEKRQLNSKSSAQKLGSYSHGYAVKIGDAEIIFTTGQIALDSGGNVLYPGDPARQAEFVFESLANILAEARATLDDVVKATIFVTDMNDFAEISKVRNRYFKNSEPSSTLVEVKKLVKDGCLVEIEVIAVKNLG